MRGASLGCDQLRILITGGSSDIAKAIVRQRSALGDTFVVTASTRESLESCIAWYQSVAVPVEGFVFDLSNPSDSLQALRELLAGGIDAAIFNAFERVPALRPFHEIDPQVTSAYLSSQVGGHFPLIAELLKHMVERRFGRLVLISSVSAIAGTSNYGVYCAAKAALEGLFLNLAVDYSQYGIFSNILRLGLFRTSRTKMFWRQPDYVERVSKLVPSGDLGAPEQVAEALGPLLSRSSYITGSALNVSGGLPLARF